MTIKTLVWTGGPYLYFNHPIIQVKKTLEEEDGYDKMADTEDSFVSMSPEEEYLD